MRIKTIFFNDKDLQHIQICLKHNVTAVFVSKYDGTILKFQTV